MVLQEVIVPLLAVTTVTAPVARCCHDNFNFSTSCCFCCCYRYITYLILLLLLLLLLPHSYSYSSSCSYSDPITTTAAAAAAASTSTTTAPIIPCIFRLLHPHVRQHQHRQHQHSRFVRSPKLAWGMKALVVCTIITITTLLLTFCTDARFREVLPASGLYCLLCSMQRRRDRRMLHEIRFCAA